MVLQDMETGTARYDAGAFPGQFPQDFGLGLIDIVGGDVNAELVGEVGVHAQRLGRRHGCHVLDKL